MKQTLTPNEFERLDNFIKPYYYQTNEYNDSKLQSIYKIKTPLPSSTGSEFGGYHWFVTLMARHKHMGEFLMDHKAPPEETLKAWGGDLFDTSNEILAWFKLMEKHLDK